MKKTRAKKIIEEIKRPVNYTVKAFVHFKDGVLSRSGSTAKVKGTDAQDAEKNFREMANKKWPDITKIEIISVKKG